MLQAIPTNLRDIPGNLTICGTAIVENTPHPPELLGYFSAPAKYSYELYNFEDLDESEHVVFISRFTSSVPVLNITCVCSIPYPVRTFVRNDHVVRINWTSIANDPRNYTFQLSATNMETRKTQVHQVETNALVDLGETGQNYTARFDISVEASTPQRYWCNTRSIEFNFSTPGPPILRSCTIVNDTIVRIMWKPPVFFGDSVDTYRFELVRWPNQTYADPSIEDKEVFFVDGDPSDVEYSFLSVRIIGLEAAVLYNASIVPLYWFGRGPASASCSVSSGMEAPEMPPANLTFENGRLVWTAPPEYSLNGGLSSYRVRLWQIGSQNSIEESCNETTATPTTIISLAASSTSFKLQEDLNADIAACNDRGCSPPSECVSGRDSVVQTTTPPPLLLSSTSSRAGLIVGVVVGIVAALCVVFVIVFMVQRRRRHHQVAADLQQLPAFQPDSNPELLAYEIKREQISIVRSLGGGQFGDVYEATVLGLPSISQHSSEEEAVSVAVKYCRQDNSFEDVRALLEEAKRMVRVGTHKHIVRLLAVSFQSVPCCLVLEYLSGLDLKAHLLELAGNSKGKSEQPDFESALVKQLLTYGQLIASAVSHLAKHQCVHRDIAARNVLLDAHLTPKLADFGLARGLYSNEYYRRSGQRVALPIYWMSPEAVFDGVFTEKSDVWAFGVLLWEIFSLGERPWAEKSARAFLVALRSSTMLSRPLLCSQPVYQVMQLCWVYGAAGRATAAQIEDALSLCAGTTNALSAGEGSVQHNVGRSRALSIVLTDRVGEDEESYL
eukprot:m.757507 g.757507  ORF g.757507 m.757507 type:complete len:783 (-) comp59023_c0_seq29:101-2449(-)